MIYLLRGPLAIGISALTGLAFFVTPYMFLASTAYFLLCLGILSRKHCTITHIRLMVTGVLIDISLVLILEIQRDAIKTATDFSLAPLQQAHIAASSLALLLYFPILYLGFQARRNPAKNTRHWHKRLGIAAFILRSLGFLLMFSMLK